ncbi:hypothetical protein Pyrfu_0860 [Pyrolobus fumarii 1A]|uniref:Uncharacterized protein n=1 Tax=Pyrolobus fumarii (strain DSM 11204 / 1A) TaxID=694429 RepID=G0EDW0_PYRF1|nr:hypothetical protein [Pyrolobus fumarii]AEM38729.1 hypothetical protein Pyrfu_0860 [Pyrolobus fumarii 1A]
MVGMYEYGCCKANIEPLERSILYMRDGLVAQVLVRYANHPVMFVLPKYVIGKGPLYARILRTNLQRVVYHYRPREVASITGRVFDPCLGGPVHTTNTMQAVACDPMCRRSEVLANPRDVLEEDASSLFLQLEMNGVVVYPTGSILGYYHNERMSDIDIVVYLDLSMWRCEDIIEVLEGTLEPLPPSEVEFWARSRNVTPHYYRKWVRGVYRAASERRVSVTFAVTQRERYCENMFVYNNRRLVEHRLKIEGGDCRVLLWPHVVEVNDDVVLLSFDGVYAPLLYEGGVFEIKGVEGVVIGKDGSVKKLIVVGIAEADTWLKRIS